LRPAKSPSVVSSGSNDSGETIPDTAENLMANDEVRKAYLGM
jgi:hypothetical protein